jgi:hypothetical protein
LLDLAREAKAVNKDHAYLCKMRVKNRMDEEFDFIPYAADKFLDKYDVQEWVVEHFDAIHH